MSVDEPCVLEGKGGEEGGGILVAAIMRDEARERETSLGSS